MEGGTDTVRRDFTGRLDALADYMKSRQVKSSRFIVEDGSEFLTDILPEQYIMAHGAQTPNGRRIVKYLHPPTNDPLSCSFYELIDSMLELGRWEWPELESDDI